MKHPTKPLKYMKHCLHPTCMIKPFYNVASAMQGIYCKAHKKPGMIYRNASALMCNTEGCARRAYCQTLDATNPVYSCGKHKQGNMVLINEKKRMDKAERQKQKDEKAKQEEEARRKQEEDEKNHLVFNYKSFLKRMNAAKNQKRREARQKKKRLLVLLNELNAEEMAEKRDDELDMEDEELKKMLQSFF